MSFGGANTWPKASMLSYGYLLKADGIGVEDCEQVSHQISALMDVEDPITGQYTLEVSSPGIPRPLFYIEQYQRFIGDMVEIKVVKSVNGKRKFQGSILSVQEHTVTLEITEKPQEFLFSNIVKAYLISK